MALASRYYDLVVIGAAKEPLFRQMLVGEIPEKVARHSPASDLVVKRYEGTVRSLVKKLLGWGLSRLAPGANGRAVSLVPVRGALATESLD